MLMLEMERSMARWGVVGGGGMSSWAWLESWQDEMLHTHGGSWVVGIMQLVDDMATHSCKERVTMLLLKISLLIVACLWWSREEHILLNDEVIAEGPLNLSALHQSLLPLLSAT
jgi:hypothetical protein